MFWTQCSTCDTWYKVDKNALVCHAKKMLIKVLIGLALFVQIYYYHHRYHHHRHYRYVRCLHVVVSEVILGFSGFCIDIDLDIDMNNSIVDKIMRMNGACLCVERAMQTSYEIYGIIA